MNYTEAVDYIETIPKFTVKHPPEHTRELLSRLGNPQEGIKIIHVAGTNGKGSVCAYLNAMLLAGGKKTGLFTSPHLVRINERFQINGEDVSDEQFLDAFLKVEKAAKEYEAEGMNEEEARETAKQNLIMTTLPKLPESGDLSESDPVLIDMKAMGGVNGYAVSAYTKAPSACLAFIDFATSYEMVTRRSEMLGIAPARGDAAESAGDVSEKIYANLENGNVVLMPSISEVSQIWTPAQTFFTDLAKDAFRSGSEKKYQDLPALKSGLEQVDTQIHDAIYTLK